MLRRTVSFLGLDLVALLDLFTPILSFVTSLSLASDSTLAFNFFLCLGLTLTFFAFTLRLFLTLGFFLLTLTLFSLNLLLLGLYLCLDLLLLTLFLLFGSADELKPSGGFAGQSCSFGLLEVDNIWPYLGRVVDLSDVVWISS